MPSRGPSAAAPSSTTIGWNVNGTGVNGSGMLICAAMAVSTVTNSDGARTVPQTGERAFVAGRRARRAVSAT